VATQLPAIPESGEPRRDDRRARLRSSQMLFALLVLGAFAAFLTTTALLMAPPGLTVGRARAHGLASIAGTLAVVLVVAALWQRHVVRAALRDVTLLRRTVEALRRRSAYDQAEFTLTSRIGGLIEVFTRTRDLQPVLKEAVQALQATLKVNTLVVQVYSEEKGKVALAIEEGGSGIDLGNETRRTVIGRGKALLVNQLSGSDEMGNLAQLGYTSLMAAPLGRGRRATDQSIGLIAALGREGREFTGRELVLLSRFARHAGLIIENAMLYKRTEHLAERDGLTDLYNQRHFVATLNSEIAKAQHLGVPVALLMGDLDNFKVYNDTHGHPKGDMVLRQVAKILLANTRQHDIAARYGGEEFVIILPGTGRVGARRVAETLRSQIENYPFEGKELSGNITITIGVAVFPDDATDAESLIQRADDALYRGKRAGKNRVTWAAPADTGDAAPAEAASPEAPPTEAPPADTP